MKEIVLLKDCPGVMHERALWARKAAVEHPESIQVDDEFLPWVYHDESGLWFSFNGNYSQSSPEEKIARYFDKQEKYRNISDKSALEWVERYNQIEYWSKVRAKVLKRDKNTCQICKAKATTKLHVHHILKRKDGGTDHFDNLITVCPKCHPVADRAMYSPDWE